MLRDQLEVAPDDGASDRGNEVADAQHRLESVDIDAVTAAFPADTVAKIAAELKTDLSPANAPLLNDVNTTVALISANAVIGVVTVDTNQDGKLDVASGDKVGVSCAFCHGLTDGSVFALAPGQGGGIGKRVDGPTPHNLNVGATFALAANSRAFYPLLQTQQADGSTIGRAPTGLTKDSTEAEVDAYLSNPATYPVGMFDDTLDGNGNTMHITPMFRTDLLAPWGSTGEFQFLDQFNNTVYTALLDPTNILTDAGKAFLAKVGKGAGVKLAQDYAAVLAATGVTGYPYVKGSTTTAGGGDLNGPVGIRVDNTKLKDLNAYFNSLPAPKGVVDDAAQVALGRELFRTTAQCTTCHNVDQSKFVPPNVLAMASVWPGDNPTIIAQRDAPLGPISNTPGNTFDDKHAVINASQRGLVRGEALPALLDLARKPVFLHDNSVPSLDNLLDPTRGATAPHPFYAASAVDRAALVAFLRSLDTGD